MAPSHYLDRCWVIDNWTLGNIYQWNCNQNTKLFIGSHFADKLKWPLKALVTRKLKGCLNCRLPKRYWRFWRFKVYNATSDKNDVSKVICPFLLMLWHVWSLLLLKMLPVICPGLGFFDTILMEVNMIFPNSFNLDILNCWLHWSIPHCLFKC